jgi:hypothetical protein
MAWAGAVFFTFFYGSTFFEGPGFLLVDLSRSHSDAPHSVGLLLTNAGRVARTYT